MWLTPKKVGTCGSPFRLTLARIEKEICPRAASTYCGTKHEVLYDYYHVVRWFLELQRLAHLISIHWRRPRQIPTRSRVIPALRKVS